MLAALILSLSQPIAVSGDWAAYDRGSSCEARSRSLLVPRKGEMQPHVTISFDRGGRRRGEIAIAFRRPVRDGSSAILTIGEQPFLLAARGGWAWSRGPAQEQAIIAAIRAAGGMRVEVRDRAGRRMVDRFALSGGPTAIDAAAACALRRVDRP